MEIRNDRSEVEPDKLSFVKFIGRLKVGHIWAVIVSSAAVVAGAFGLGLNYESNKHESELARLGIKIENADSKIDLLDTELRIKNEKIDVLTKQFGEYKRKNVEVSRYDTEIAFRVRQASNKIEYGRKNKEIPQAVRQALAILDGNDPLNSAFKGKRLRELINEVKYLVFEQEDAIEIKKAFNLAMSMAYKIPALRDDKRPFVDREDPEYYNQLKLFSKEIWPEFLQVTRWKIF